jgi:hypothetical protein
MMSAPAPDPQKLLEQFVVNNADLERLESLLNQFNIFEAVGMVRLFWQQFLKDELPRIDGAVVQALGTSH